MNLIFGFMSCVFEIEPCFWPIKSIYTHLLVLLLLSIFLLFDVDFFVLFLFVIFLSIY